MNEEPSTKNPKSIYKSPERKSEKNKLKKVRFLDEKRKYYFIILFLFFLFSIFLFLSYPNINNPYKDEIKSFFYSISNIISRIKLLIYNNTFIKNNKSFHSLPPF